MEGTLLLRALIPRISFVRSTWLYRAGREAVAGLAALAVPEAPVAVEEPLTAFVRVLGPKAQQVQMVTLDNQAAGAIKVSKAGWS